MQGQKPEINVKSSKVQQQLNIEDRVVIIAQAEGTATAKKLYKDVEENEVDDLFGKGSLATIAFKRFKTINKISPLDVIPLSEPSSGNQAEGGVSFVGTATEAGTLKFRVCDDEYSFHIDYNSGDKAEAFALAFKTAVENENMPFTVAIDSGTTNVVKINSRAKGVMGNLLTVTFENRVPGITLEVTDLVGGTGTYDTSGITDQLKEKYRTVIFDMATSPDMINDFLVKRFDALNKVLDGHGIFANNSSSANEKRALFFSSGSEDRRNITLIGNLNEQKTNCVPILVATEVGAIRELKLTEGGDMTPYVYNDEDVEGGDSMSSLPYHNTPLLTYNVPVSTLSDADYNILNELGVTFLTSSRLDPNKCVLSEVRTLARFDNTKYRLLNQIDCVSVIKKRLFKIIAENYVQVRAQEDGGVSTTVVNENTIKASVNRVLYDSIDDQILQDNQTSKGYIDETVVNYNAEKDVFEVKCKFLLMRQLRAVELVVESI